jgi:hypothetical protein
MTAVRALLDHKAASSSRRAAARRKLHLQAHGSTYLGGTDVFVLDLSSTGLLLETTGDLSKGETIELDMPEASGVRAVVKWSSGRLFGCEFTKPISVSAISAALLRASPTLPKGRTEYASENEVALADGLSELADQNDLSFAAKARGILTIALLCWIPIIAAAWSTWRYFR